MKRFLRTKNTVTALLVAFIYASHLVSGTSLVCKIIGTIAIFGCIQMMLDGIDEAYAKECRKRKEVKVQDNDGQL